MAITNKSITINGSDAKVTSAQIFPQVDGKVVIVVAGGTLDSEGTPRALKEAQILYQPGANDVVSDLLAKCLDALRKMNGLEDAPIVLEPKVDAQPATK